MKVSGCIVTYNDVKTIEKCISSILKATSGIEFTLYVSDNCSTDGTVELIQEKFPQVIVLENEKNGGYGYGNNQILDKIDSKYHCVINPDIYMEENTIGSLVEYLENHNEVGMITPKILNVDGTQQYLPKYTPSIRYVLISKIPGFRKYRRLYTRQDENLEVPTEIGFCTGCFFVMPTELFVNLHGFDEDFYMYCEDADLSKRVMKMGKHIIFHPEYYVYHDWNRENTKSIRGIKNFLISLALFFRKWNFKF